MTRTLKGFTKVLVGSLVESLVAGLGARLILALLPGLMLIGACGLEGDVPVGFIAFTVVYAVICFLGGRKFPRYAGRRSALSFFWVVLVDAGQHHLFGQSDLLSWEPEKAAVIAGVIAGGMGLCFILAILGALGGEGLQRWWQDEMEEFHDSLAMFRRPEQKLGEVEPEA